LPKGCRGAAHARGISCDWRSFLRACGTIYRFLSPWPGIRTRSVSEIHKLLKTNPTLRIALEGHTDNAGTKAGNQALSAQRATSVKQAVVDKGIAADRIQALGYGQDRPVAENGTDDGRAKNRRVELRKL